MSEVTITQARDNLSQLIQKALSGEEIIIRKGKTPLVRLVPLRPATPKRKTNREIGADKGLIKMSDDFDEPLDDFKEYMF